jgi:16S rRNA (guanine527-N7)-methyltransferase
VNMEPSLRPDWTSGFSAETVQRLERHLSMLVKWNAAINMVAPASLAQAWTRHFQDSIQIFDLRGEGCRHWVDLGSGAGFPGLVVASLAAERAPDMRMTLVESDRRKAEFLRSVSRETGLAVTVLDSRVEAVPPLQADVVSARALAPLPELCAYAARHLAPAGRGIFLKGARAEDELRAAKTRWRFNSRVVPSITEAAASVLVITDLHRG